MREVHCADAVPWLEQRSAVGAVVTSLPDAAEMDWSLAEWSPWFVRAATAAMRATNPEAPAIFYQTDRKADGELHSKAALLFTAARAAKARLLWHKIVLRREPGAVDLHRPGYTHLLAFSASCPPGKATADVLAAGRMIYPNAMGLGAAIAAVSFAGRYAPVICDPFCGRGTVLAVAEALGFRAVGVDIDPAQVAAAKRLRLAAPKRGLARAS